jgi:hypothetical protein
LSEMRHEWFELLWDTRKLKNLTVSS